jgi:hypothetical protein
MRILLALGIAAGMGLFVVGALVPGMFALSLIGMVVLAGVASLGLAAVMQHPGPRTNY